MNNTIKGILTLILCFFSLPVFLSFMVYVVNMPVFVSAYILNYIFYGVIITAILSIIIVLIREDEY